MNLGLATMLLALLLAGCVSLPRPSSLQPWVYTNLRLLDETSSPEAGSAPEQDLIAIYSRSFKDEFQVRLDLLDLEPRPEADIYLALDTSPGGSSRILQDYLTLLDWDTLVIIPASGLIQALTVEGMSRSGLAIRVLRDPLADTITISLDRSSLPSASLDISFQVFLTRPGGSIPVDSSLVIDSTVHTPPRASVLLAFWNTLPAYTPSQAMRRWDGAHSGPFGGRHGLRNLLRVARSHKVPLALLDLKNPTSLAALDYVEGIQMIRAMAGEGLLILPDSVPPDGLGLPPWAVHRAMAESRQIAASAQLPNSLFAYLPLPSNSSYDLSDYRLIFTQASLPSTEPEPGITRILSSRTDRILPIPDLSRDNSRSIQPNEGPPIEMRRDLVEAARQEIQDPGSRMLVLGGEFLESPWGDPQFARLALDWIDAHPWIKPLGPQDLLAWAPAGDERAQQSENQIKVEDRNAMPAGERFTDLAEQIHQAPPGLLAETAWQSFLTLLIQPSPGSEDLNRLRAHYAGQIGPILAAARWSTNPLPQQNCSQDLDQDGLPECVLASEDTFAVLEIASGSLAYLFACSPNQESQASPSHSCSSNRSNLENSIHELVAPSSQFLFGQGDPRQVVYQAGLAADPDVIPGAFFDWEATFYLSESAGRLTFTSEYGYAKRYSLIPSGVRVQFQSPLPLAVQIPLAFDPWLRFRPGWSQSYSGASSVNSWTWGQLGGPQVRVSSNGQIFMNNFNDTRALMGTVEDPNTDFPPGHFLPFPISLVEVLGQDSFSVEIQLVEESSRPASALVQR